MGFFKKLKFWRKKNKGADLKKRVEELEKKNAELQDKLEKKDREWEQVVAILRGQKCEPEEMIAARDGEMDANQQTSEPEFLQETIEEENEDSTLKPNFMHLEMHEIRPRVDNTIVMKQIRELQDFVLYWKQTVTNLESDRGERIEIQKKQEEELQVLRVKNNELENENKTILNYEVDIILELEQFKIKSDRLNEEWKLEMKNCNYEKEILVMRNKELQKKLEQLQLPTTTS